MSKGDRGEQHPLIHRLPIKKDGRIVAYKEVVSFRGLLHKGHEAGLHGIETTVLQRPSKDNSETAIVHATVRITKGTFTGTGDANRNNVNARIAPHIIRMAETRAVARALRLALDIGIVALEELEADLDEGVTYEGNVTPANTGGRPSAGANGGSRSSDSNGSRRETRGGSGSDDFKATEKQRKFLFRLVHEAGYAGDDARKLLHEQLQVSSVKDATKAAVSALIDRLKDGEFNRGNGHAGAAQ